MKRNRKREPMFKTSKGHKMKKENRNQKDLEIFWTTLDASDEKSVWERERE